MKNKGFTLAEILITLGIIGVVAAITIPMLVANYRKKTLETSFKRSYSIVSQAIMMVAAHTEDFNLYNTYVQYDVSKGGWYMSKEWTDNFYRELKIVGGTIPSSKIPAYKTYPGNKTVSGVANVYVVIYPNKILPDGSTIISGVVGTGSGPIIYVVVDTNGLKGPNRFGFDYFMFYITQKNELTAVKTSAVYDFSDKEIANDPTLNYKGDPCSRIKSKASLLNGTGCAGYALADICPDDNSKGYWECLPY